MPQSLSATAVDVAARRGIARARDFLSAGVPLVYLKRLCVKGDLVRLGRGLYQLPAAVGADAHHALAEVARAVPAAVICLLSALRYHDLTTQLPHAVWVAIPSGARTPRSAAVSLVVVRVSEPALSFGIQTVEIEGVPVSMTTVAKTVADCFKYRRRVGMDVAVEALRDAVRRRMATPAALMAAAKVDRVAHLMRPYLDAML